MDLMVKHKGGPKGSERNLNLKVVNGDWLSNVILYQFYGLIMYEGKGYK